MVATDSRRSVPPHIQPPMAHVPSATRDTFSWVRGIFTNSVSTVGIRALSDDDMKCVLLIGRAVRSIGQLPSQSPRDCEPTEAMGTCEVPICACAGAVKS